MKNITRHTGKLEIVERMKSSANGNPRFLILIDGICCVTQVDHIHGYEIPNYDGQQVVAEIGTHYGRATLYSIWAV